MYDETRRKGVKTMFEGGITVAILDLIAILRSTIEFLINVLG